MKLSGIADDTELKLAGTSGDMEQKRKNTVSLPSDLNNVTVKQTQAGDIADRNRRVENPRVQTGGLRPKDVAAAMKAAAVSGAGVNSNVWTAGAKADAMRAGSEGGTSYGATRPDSFSDATQNTNDALITNNPGDVHLGGIVSPDSKIYGELPKEDSTFYINQKFEEVEPFPIMMPDGNLYNSRTSNLNKAEWQFWSNKVSAPDMGWAGYFKIAKPEGEAWTQTAIRSAYNLIPEMLFSAGQYVATAINTASYLYDWAAKDHDRALENYNYYQDMIEDTVRDYMDATKWYYSDASEAGANKYAVIVGQTLGSVAVASLGSRAAVAALAAGEGLSDAASVQRATRELGYSPLASLGAGALAGGVTSTLSFLPEYVFPNGLDDLAKKTGKSLLGLAVRSPGAITKAVAQNGWRRVILEAGTEVGQELFAGYASAGFDSENMEARWDEKVAILLASLAMGGAGLYHNITKANKGEAELREFATKMNDMIKAVEPELRRIASESGGLINDSNIDEILAHIKDPDFALQMTNIVRESIVGNFDKFSPEEKASLMEKIKSWDGEALLSEEFAKLESRVDELLKDSGLTAAQKERFRTYIRGTAAWQLATLGIKPSQMDLPVSVSATPADSNVAGFTRDSDGAIFVTTRGANLPVSALYGRVPAKPRNRSARQSAEMSGKVAVADMTNTDTAQTVGEAFATHEFTHWIQKNTGLHGVDAYMKALTNAVETMMPGLLKSLEAKPSRGGNKAAVKAAKKQRKLDVSKAEAYAYVMQYAGAKATEIMGTEGKVADVMSFMNMMLKASDASTKLSPQLQKVFDLFESTMKENKKLMNALLAEIPYEQLRGAVRDFVETGDPSNIGLDAVRALHVVLNSIVDGETSDLLGQVFTNRAVAEDFMNATNAYYRKAHEAESAAERAVREEVRKEADAVVGIATEETPVVNTVADAVVEGVVDEIPDFNETQEVSKREEVEPQEDSNAKVASEDEPKAAVDQDVKEWVNSPHTVPAAENRTGATKNIEEMAEQKLLEWRVHIPEIIRMEITSPVADDLELTWEDSSDQTPFRFKSEVRSNPEKRKQLQARLKQYYNTIVGEVNRRIGEGEMSDSGKRFIESNGLFVVWNPNMLWSDEYVTHLANKIAGHLEGQVATEAEKQLYSAIRTYEVAIGYLYDENTSMLEPQEKTELALQYLDDLSRELYSIEVGEDVKVDGFIHGLSDAAAARIAGREIAEQYQNAIIPTSSRSLSKTPYYRNRSIWLQEGLLKRVQNRVNYLATKLNEGMYRDDFGTELRDIEISDEIKAGVSEEQAKAVREELGSLKKAYLEAVSVYKKASDAFNAQPTSENNEKLVTALASAKSARDEVIRAAQRNAEVLEYVPLRAPASVERVSLEVERNELIKLRRKLQGKVSANKKKTGKEFDALNAELSEVKERLSAIEDALSQPVATVRGWDGYKPYPSIARFFSPKRLGGDFLHQNAQDDAGGDWLLKTDESKWAQFINPARPERAVGRTHPINTPTPLEQIELETGFTFADAQKVVTDAGLRIPKLDLSDVTPEKIVRYYDDGVATFSRVYARLLNQVASWGGAGSLDYATRMRLLVGIDMAKQAAREIVGEYQISKEIGFMQNPTRGLGITASAVKFDQSEKGAAARAENAKQGYIAVANPYELRAGDQVAFAKGNKIVKAAVSYVMPVGANKAVFLRHLVDVSDIDVDNMTREEIFALDKKMVEDVISASDLSKVAVMQKVVVEGDAERIGKMFDAYDKVLGAVQRDNWTLEALASVPPETLQGQIAADILENMQSVYDPYENSGEDDFGGNGMYAIMPDIVPSTPVIDPGKFVVRNLDMVNPDTTNPITLSDEEFQTLFGDPDAFDAALKAAQDYAREKSKPSFANVMKDTAFSGRNQMYGMTPLKQFDIVDKGLNETKTSRFLYPFGAATGLDRKLALNIGQKNAQEAFGFIEAASVAQQEKESRTQAMIDNAVEAVFGGKRTAYDRWRIAIKNDSIETAVEGVKQKVSEAEIMSLYAMKRRSDIQEANHAKNIESYNAGDRGANELPPIPMDEFKKRSTQFKRAAAPFGGVEAASALIEKLSPESKKFVEVIGSQTIRSVSNHPEWVPAVEFEQYRGSGWASRKKNKVEYIPAFELVNSDTPLAALDYYDSVTKAITKYAMDASGLRTQLENLQMIFEFDKRVDRSKFAPIMPGSADEALFNEMSRRSKLMRDKLAEKIGTRMANAFIKNIEYDLKNPAFLDDVAATPEAKWFGRFSRSSGASVLMLNIKQGLQNLGNYHRLFGLSGNSMFKYYTTDWVKAVAHTREAWALMKQNPELLRRLKQAGLSEHMIRVVDENSDSIFTDIQAKFLEHGKTKASNATAFLGTVSNMATKWGMAPNVFGDALGLAWGNYAVYDHVRSQVSAANKPTLLKRRDGTDVEAAIDVMTQREIGNYINSHISSSNYMARSMFTKMMNKMGLGALVMFTNDQLQGFGSLAQAISVLQNSKDKVELERARKDIMAWAVSTVRYIAIKAGWYSALAAMAMGKDLSDEEMDYIWDSTISEAVMQMGGWHQLSNLGIAPVLRAIIDGDRLGPSIVSVSAAGRGISAARRGDWWDFASEAASMTFFPVANGLSRVVEAVNYMMSSNEHEQQVGLKMLGGSSKGGAMESLGLSDKNEDKEVKPKKKLKKDGE